MPRVILLPAAADDIEKTPLNIKGRLLDAIIRLGDWPAVSGCKPLSGDLAGHFRVRVGDWRIQFRVDAGEVVIGRIGHRDGFYE